MRGRKPSQKSRYYLPSKSYRLAQDYAANYECWSAEIKSLRNQSRAIDYSKDKVQSSGSYDPTMETAIDVNELQYKLDIIDECISLVSEGLDDYIRLAVCYDYTYRQLTTGRLRMPLNKNKFGQIKHHFYFELYQRI